MEEKQEKQPEFSSLLKNTFLSSYLILMGYTGITLIEAIRTPSPHIRHIMNIETTVSLVAGLVYSLFNEEIKKPSADLHKITELRYVDWMITTPLILLALLLFYNSKAAAIDYKTYSTLIALNAGMLLAGFLGERGTISKQTGISVGFAFYAALLAMFYTYCIPSGSSPVVFGIFAVIWTLYGVAYMVEDEEQKNIFYNILDVISKALFGVVLWMYFGKILKF
jgi:sensory rhodopsin